MKVKLQAGAELDMLTAEELRRELEATLKGWVNELGRGAKFRRFSAAGTVDAAGNLLIGAPAGNREQLGPSEGFIWAVTRLAVSGHDPAAQTISVYTNDPAPSQLVQSGIARVVTWDKGVLALNSDDALVIAGAGLTVGAQVTVSGAAIEVPQFAAWTLL